MKNSPKQDANREDVVPVYVTSNVIEAQIIKEALLAENIPAEVDSLTQGVLIQNDQVHVLVRAGDFERARDLIDRRGAVEDRADEAKD